MATPGKKAPCSTCGKERGGVRCEGCSKIFCLNHFDGHRQELSKQLDEVEVTRDLFRQTLTDKIAEPQKHALTEQINEWEYQSINKIRQAAEEARQILLKHTAELNTKLEDQLNNLTKQLRQSREEKDFHETDIDQWREELTGMANELAEPSSITIRQDPTSLVTKITVEISDERHDKNFYQEARITSSSESAAENKKYIILNVALATHPEAQNTTPQPSNSGTLITIICPHCHYEFDQADSEIHQENCLRNPNSISKKQQLRNNPTSDQNSNRLNHTDQPNDTADIPCEYCNQRIKWCNYSSHMQVCATEHYPRIQKQSQPTYRIDEPDRARCRYCNKECKIKHLEMHHGFCPQNPNNIALEKRYRTIFPSLLPPST